MRLKLICEQIPITLRNKIDIFKCRFGPVDEMESGVFICDDPSMLYFLQKASFEAAMLLLLRNGRTTNLSEGLQD